VPWRFISLKPQKRGHLRQIRRIRLAFTAILSASAPFALAACATGDLNLGLRGDTADAGRRGSTPLAPDAASKFADAGAVDRDGGRADASGIKPTADAGSPEAGLLDASADLAPRRSSGCGVDPPTLDDSIQVGAMRGSYLVDLPADYDRDRALPLIMAFHGAVGSATAFRGSLDLSSAVSEVFPCAGARCARITEAVLERLRSSEHPHE